MEDLGKPPGEGGFGRGSWNHMMLAGRVRDKFDAARSPRAALGRPTGSDFCSGRRGPCRTTAPRPGNGQNSLK